MTNRPNVSPEDVVKARLNAGHSKPQAARTVWRTLRCWENWECTGANHRPPDPAVFMLYLIKTRQLDDWRWLFPTNGS